jgi:hypothetical protein
MGAFTTKPDIVIKDKPGWEDGEYITIKGVVEAGDVDVMSASIAQMDANGQPQVSSKTSMVASLQCMIVDWMLMGDNKQQVPLFEGMGRARRKRLDVIAKLPQAYMGPVMVAIGELMGESQVEDQDGFLPGVNGLSVPS